MDTKFTKLGSADMTLEPQNGHVKFIGDLEGKPQGTAWMIVTLWQDHSPNRWQWQSCTFERD